MAEFKNIYRKKGVLSAASSLLDPLGLQVTVFPKLLLQEIWNVRLGWDEPLPQKFSRRFTKEGVSTPRILGNVEQQYRSGCSIRNGV